MARPGLSRPASHVLLVEGPDDKHVVRHLHARSGSTTVFCILDKGNVDEVLASIGPELKAPGRQAVGIIVDANSDVTGRWNAVTSHLSKAGVQSPRTPADAGTIIPGTPRVGVWLMPDNKSQGELEDFVVQMIPQEDPVWPLSKRYIDGIPEGHRKFTEKKSLRAQLYGWLAAREEPRLMGVSIRARDLDVNGVLSRTFAAWLTRLFS